MRTIIEALRKLHNAVFGLVERITEGWFFGLFCRFVFAATLYFYYLNSAKTKVGDGILGFFQISSGAYFQIAPTAMAAVDNEPSALSFPVHLMVIAGTYGEFILPLLVIFGLFARVGAVGMIVFIVVQTFVDATAHGVALGAWFDRMPTDILDQRTFWVVPLLYVAIKGPGLISLDYPLSRWWRNRA